MVQGINENRKTQTRRTKGLEEINKNPELYRYDGICTDEDDSYQGSHFFEYINNQGKPLETYHPIDCPYNVGDVFWVRETFCGIIQKDESTKYHYKANSNWALKEALKIIWKPSLFMPKKACRFFLKIKSIRAERLQDISEEDAIAEGIEIVGKSANGLTLYKEYHLSVPNFHPVTSFRSLWISINGIDSWMESPFVWVYEFERINKPLNFGV